MAIGIKIARGNFLQVNGTNFDIDRLDIKMFSFTCRPKFKSANDNTYCYHVKEIK
ncbi:hypothetical protein PA7559_22360 [Pseudoalteromonas distincta]